MVVQFIVFLTLSTLICRGTDISKCFSESLGIRDNESQHLRSSMRGIVTFLIPHRLVSDAFTFPVVSQISGQADRHGGRSIFTK